MQEIFIKKLNNIKSLEDYEMTISSNRYPSFKKKDDEKILTIGAGDLFEMKINSVGCHLIFYPIEKYLQKIEEDWKADFKPTIKQYNHNTLTGQNFGKNIYEYFPIEINSEENIETGIKLIDKFIKQDAIPFFSFWKNITQLLPWLEVDYLDFESMNKVFLQDSILKKAILWYLTDHPEKVNFVEFHINRLNKILKENKRAKKGLVKLIKLKETLENETPKYIWNPEYIKVNNDG